MNGLLVRTRNAAKSVRSRAVRPAVEGLEGRLLLYAYTGDHFAYGNLITWSIMPDGTNLGGTTSNLVSTLNAKLGAGVWEQAITDAFAQWEQYGNINVAQVSDDGEPFNAGNLQQGNSGFGDIRIGGFAQASNVLAFTMLPPAANGGSDSGDIFFNTNQIWNINSTYDLETVAVHEIGHAVAGLGESSDPYAAEYEYYTGIKQGLDQDDISGIQAVWGPRAPDAWTRAYSNYTPANAADLTSSIIPSSNQIYLANLDVASSTASYWYKVTTPSNTNNYLWVQIQSAGWSELSPKVQIYNSALQGLTQVSASTSTYGTTIYADVGNVTPGQTYYIKVTGSSVLANGTGDYAMGVDLGPYPLSLVASPIYPIAAQPDQGGGGIFEKTAAVSTTHALTPETGRTPNSPGKPGTAEASTAVASVPIPLETSSHLQVRTSATVAHRPTHLNVPHPVASHRRTRPVAQADNARSGRE